MGPGGLGVDRTQAAKHFCAAYFGRDSRAPLILQKRSGVRRGRRLTMWKRKLKCCETRRQTRVLPKVKRRDGSGVAPSPPQIRRRSSAGTPQQNICMNVEPTGPELGILNQNNHDEIQTSRNLREGFGVRRDDGSTAELKESAAKVSRAFDGRDILSDFLPRKFNSGAETNVKTPK